MLYLIHGNDNLNSRNYFLSKRDDKSISFDAENINFDELTHALKGSSLFMEHRKIFIDNLFSKKGTKNLTQILNLLENNSDQEIYIWSDKQISTNKFSKVKKVETKVFKIPENIWGFLDNIKPKNPTLITLFHATLKTTEPEIIFSMIIRQFRLLISAKFSSKSQIDEYKRLAPWQKSKLDRQAMLFEKQQLKNIYKKLYKIDIENKTGKSSLNLTKNIDFLLLEI